MRQEQPLRSRLIVLENFASLRLDHTLASVGHSNSVRAGGYIAEHQHPDLMEICYLARGEQVYSVAGKDYALHAGEVFVTFPGELHSTGGNPQEKEELFWMQLYLPRKGRFLNMAAEEARGIVEGLRRLPTRHFAVRRTVTELFPRLFVSVEQAMGRGRLEGIERIEVCGIAGELLIEVIRSAETRDDTKRETADLNRAIEFVAGHIDERIGVEDIAQELGLSTSWFQAKFRRVMGIPPGEYILRAKVAKAREMLVSGQSVTKVAYHLEFGSSQYFATVFKRFTGKTPTEVARTGTISPVSEQRKQGA